MMLQGEKVSQLNQPRILQHLEGSFAEKKNGIYSKITNLLKVANNMSEVVVTMAIARVIEVTRVIFSR